MTIGTLKSPNPRNRISISVIKSKFLSVSSMNSLLAILKVTDARRDVILAGGLYHRFPWRHLPPAGADRLTFEGVWVILETKISCRLILKETNFCKEIPGEKNSYAEKVPFMAYNAGKKVLHRCLSGKNILLPEVLGKNSFPDQITYTLPPPPQSNDVIVQFDLSFHYIV